MAGVPLALFMGPMCSGKTKALLRAVAAARAAARAVTLVKHAIDVRSGPRTVASRAGLALQADVVVPCLDALSDIHLAAGSILAVDEAQFFGGGLLRLYARARAARLGGLLVAGLDLDYRNEPFGAVLQLAQLAGGESPPAATTIHRLTARCGCGSCAAPAPYTQRLLPPSGAAGAAAAALDEVVLVGGAESYAPACASHHRPLPLAAADWAAQCP